MSSPTDMTARAVAVRATRNAAAARLLSWAAAAIGIGVVVLFLVQAGLFRAMLPQDAEAPPVVDNPDQITATDSTVKGIDTENQPYEVTAKHGWQDKDTPSLVHLEQVAATFRKPDGRIYVMSSDTGLYDTKLKVMDIAGNVVITEGTRFTARMDKARVEVATKALSSASPVVVDSAQGKIAANGLQISDDGNRILFLNGVKAQFGAAPAPGDQP